jgi:light-regulated signal transduction histidine kinase (bacteriophytochrome)
LVNAAVISDDAGKLKSIRVMIIDHAERKRFEDEILKLNTLLQEHGYSLEATNKELEAFIYSVSHDLRAPLRAINGFTKIILDDHNLSLNSEIQSLLRKVWDNANKMRLLIEDLLRLSRTNRQQLSLTVIDMKALFSSMIEETRQNYPGYKIAVVMSPLPKATGDLALLKQVISNLLSNAVKFSGKKEKSEIEIGWFQESENVVYYLKDNGIGFDMKYAQDLFGVFRRLSNSEDYEGTGVGLALVKRIIERHGGRVWATGVPNGGATFYFTIPYVKITE